MNTTQAKLDATLEGFRKDLANQRVSMMIWTAALAGLIIAVITGFNLYGGDTSPVP